MFYIKSRKNGEEIFNDIFIVKDGLKLRVFFQTYEKAAESMAKMIENRKGYEFKIFEEF